MATTKATATGARSPKRIRRWLQASAVGSVLFSSAVFGVIAAQSASGSTQPASTTVASPVAAVSATSGTAGTAATANSAVASPMATATATKTATTTSSVTVQARTRAS